MQKPQTLGCDCSVSGIIRSYCFLRKLYFLRPRESARNNIWREFAIIIWCSPCIFVGSVLIIAKVSLWRVGTYSEGKKPRYRYLSSGIKLSICWRETLSLSGFFFTTPKLVSCNRGHLYPQYNEISFVFWTKVKFSSSLCGSLTSFG